jgi:hypothetical protein
VENTKTDIEMDLIKIKTKEKEDAAVVRYIIVE